MMPRPGHWLLGHLLPVPLLGQCLLGRLLLTCSLLLMLGLGQRPCIREQRYPP